MQTLSRKEIDRLQAARIGEALVEVAAERGYATTTIADVVERAGVSRRTFYDLYESKDEAFVAAREVALRRAARRVRAAVEHADGSPTTRLRAAIGQAVALMKPDPARTRLLIFEGGSDALDGSGVVGWTEDLVNRFGLAPAMKPVPAHDLLAAASGLVRSRLEADPPDLDGLGDALEGLLLARRPRSPWKEPEPDEGAPDAQLQELIDAIAGSAARRSARIEELTELAVTAAIYRDELTLRAVCEQVSGLLERPLRLTSDQRDSLLRLDGMCKAALDGGPSAALAVLGAARLHGEQTVHGLPLRIARYLQEHPGATSAEIADAVGERHPSAVSRALRQLRGKGLVSVESAGRSKRWELTEEGTNL